MNRASLKQKWNCSRIEEDFGEGDGLDWYEDDEMVRRWEDTSKGGEDCEGEDVGKKSLQAEVVQRAPAKG